MSFLKFHLRSEHFGMVLLSRFISLPTAPGCAMLAILITNLVKFLVYRNLVFTGRDERVRIESTS